ncbi:MAG TPA: aromatic ring-hydroxylating dioxygenase subunit alpha [Acidimicrobiales bacterium]|nr:aromatic ring-hydroxylating dioxygenase subunit alpha [Acidimicrobiales bacterium]
MSEVPAFRDYWYPVAYSEEVGTKPVEVRLFGESLVVWRPGEAEVPSAAYNECPHRGALLSQGWLEGGCLVCPYHGWRFDAAGACRAIPSQDPQLPIPPRARIRSVLAREKYRLVWLCVGMPRADVPALADLDAGYTLIHELKEVWAASAPRMIDNALDVAHVAFVHRGTVGDPEHPRLSDFKVERQGERLSFSVTLQSRVRGAQVANTGLSGVVNRTTHAELVQPFVFRGVLEYETGLRHVLYKTCSPVDDRHTLICQFIGRNDNPPPDRWDAIAAVDRAVQREDRALLEGIAPDFPLSPTAELHTRSDRMTIEYRRILASLAAESGSAPAGVAG